MRTGRLLLVIAASVALGALATLAVLSLRRSPLDRWITMDEGGIGDTNEALTKSDIAMPNMSRRRGSVKFVEAPGEIYLYQLGYRLELTIEPLDVKRIPEKYRRTESTYAKSGVERITEPIDQVVYDATAEFELKDGDGFVLQHVTSQPFALTSGKKIEFQALAGPMISLGVARRTKRVDFYINVFKCETCR